MRRFLAFWLAVSLLVLAGCGIREAEPSQPEPPAVTAPDIDTPTTSPNEPAENTPPAETSTPVQTGLFAEQILSGADGDIHYSYYLPDSYDGSRKFPMMVVMPGYDMMWFGEDSSGSNLNWSGFTAWTKLDTEIIVVSAQLTDWGEKSARQAIELTEYFISHFAVDTSRVYAAGYSARAAKPCPVRCPCGPTCMPPIFTALLSGMATMRHCGERRGGLYLHGRGRRVLRQRQGPARPMKTSIRPTRPPVGETRTLTVCCGSRHPIMPSSTPRVSTTTTVALMWSLTIRIT